MTCDSCGKETNREEGEPYCYPCDPTFGERMTKYTIIIEETLQHTIEVEAENWELAGAIAVDQRYQMDYNEAVRHFDAEQGVVSHSIETDGFTVRVENK